MNRIQVTILQYISSALSIISLVLVLSIRLKFNYIYTLPERIVIGIIISDLLYEICLFCSIFIAPDQKNLSLIFTIITGISISYSYISAFMISYISWQQISNIQFSLEHSYKNIQRFLQISSVVIGIPNILFTYICLEKSQLCAYDAEYFIARIVILTLGMILNYSRVVYELRQRGVSIFSQILQLYWYPLIMIITQLPVQILFFFRWSNNIIQYNIYYSIGLFDSLAYGYLIYQNYNENHQRTVSIDKSLIGSELNIL